MAPTIAIARRVSALEGLVHLRVLSRDEIGTWRGRHDFVHRLKPLMIRDLTGRVRDEKLLYVDADSAFVAPVSRLSEPDDLARPDVAICCGAAE